MPRPTQNWKWVSSLLAAGLGQFFLAQAGQGWTLPLGLFLYLSALFLFGRSTSGRAPAISLKGELAALTVVGLLGLFFRLYRFSGMPPGILAETACGPWLGYAVPMADWPAYYTGNLSLTHPDIPLWASLWFHLLPPSQMTYGLFYFFLSLAAFPLGYLLFRDLAGPVTALTTLFLWSVMEWPFYGRFNVLLLGHSQQAHLHSLETTDLLKAWTPPPGRGLFFALPEGRTGVLAVLQKLYPRGSTERLLDPWGRSYLYFFRVPAGLCGPSHYVSLPVRRYWRGTLRLEKAGLYRFLMLATDHTEAEMEVGGKETAVANQEAVLSMQAKDYRVVIRYEREGGFENAFHLVWKPPGAAHYEVLPPEALK